ncbi:helix-turn-helix domain-containing protein [Leisingera sp. ANG-Vp]|uniref:helix-turn-helix domain-containing protein n=1 Tax=Leisingera sp. ANG-Vp TaxID=1577896 RepID=UPI000A643288|nr:helix-turn-helix domain-containing protein [Leisingera sp. ANG-Vp]
MARKRYSDEDILKLLREIELKHAHQLLCQTDLPMMEVCVASGFASKSNFAHWYRQQYRQMPTQARKLCFTGAAG